MEKETLSIQEMHTHTNTYTHYVCVYIIYMYVCMHVRLYIYCAKLLQSCPTLCDPIDRSPPGFPVHGILQTRILVWVLGLGQDLPDPRIEPVSLTSPALAGKFFTISTKCWCMHIHIYIHTHIYIYTYIHIYTCN